MGVLVVCEGKRMLNELEVHRIKLWLCITNECHNNLTRGEKTLYLFTSMCGAVGGAQDN